MLTEPLLCSEVMNWNAALLAETDNEKKKNTQFCAKTKSICTVHTSPSSTHFPFTPSLLATL
jgi:hypothetical protein